MNDRVWVVDDQASFRLATAATVAATEDFVMAGESAPPTRSRWSC
jgi:two-component system, NarL family, invasion response regulator UvrY